MKENVIEWFNGDSVVSVTLSQVKLINKIKKLKEKYPNDINIIAENDDGSMFVKFPLKYIKINAPRVITEEQRQQAKERLTQYHKTSKEGEIDE